MAFWGCMNVRSIYFHDIPLSAIGVGNYLVEIIVMVVEMDRELVIEMVRVPTVATEFEVITRLLVERA